MSKNRSWIAVLNNYTSQEHATFIRVAQEPSAITYAIVAEEVGVGGTRHLQCFFVFASRKTLMSVKQYLGTDRVHLEPKAPKSTHKQAADYCKKEANFREFGTLPVQGKRTDLEEIKQGIIDGLTDREIATNYFSRWVVYRRAFEEYRHIISRPETVVHYGPYKWSVDEEFHSLVLWGPAGIGKTEFAKSLLPKALFVSHIDDLARYNEENYDGIIFDDMSFVHLPREAQIHIVDFDNPRSIHIRYGVARIPAGTKKVFTSNIADGAIFLDDAAINRRIIKTHIR